MAVNTKAAELSDADLQALLNEATVWVTGDIDVNDKAEISALVAAARQTSGGKRTPGATAAIAELQDRFSGPLAFGTAGLRGAMAAGPNRMNRAVVARAAAGLAAFLKDALPGKQPRVVIGYDGRKNSAEFARDSAAIMAAAGVETYLLPRMLPTPLLAYAVRRLPADAGVMVTASHNPAQDNGYKVYLGGRVVQGPGQGAQIVPPYDAKISAKIAEAPAANAIPMAQAGYKILDDEIVEAYVKAVEALSDGAPRDLRIVTTSMHGVGGPILNRVLGDVGFEDVFPVKEQLDPDPNFPTVAFPNPEEPGAMDMAIAKAEEVNADLVIANDPDADRCAVAVFDPRIEAWRKLHGDEVGALLAYAVTQSLTDADPDATMANSIVSSRLLGKIAAKANLKHENTLTGFKWITRTPNLVYGYEEALGYCVDPASVRDKDGISASLVIAQLANSLKAEGRTLIDLLDDLAREHGLFLTDQLSLRYDDLSQIGATMAKLRANPPTTLVGSPVVELADLSNGYHGLPATDGVLLRASDDTRVIVRPSGTEPKVKCYLEVVHPVEFDADFDKVSEARASAQVTLDALKDEMAKVLKV